MTESAVVTSPIGRLRLEASAGRIVAIEFNAREPESRTLPSGVLQDAARQLDEYFAGRRTQFSLPLSPQGTEFQQAVWRALITIPYGSTVSYRDLAERLGKPAAVRAVGAADGQNPIPIVIPCHRVIGANGKLVGFGGGLEAKAFLLRLEQGALF